MTTKTKAADKNSVFSAFGLRGTVDAALTEARDLYSSDQVPWVVGYSGGKDSTAALQLVWLALAGLEPKRRTKTVHVISTDTLVENPVVAAWVTDSLEKMKQAAMVEGLPIEVHRLTPSMPNRYWVNLLGRGYPAPRHKFRWCTERLKISPSNDFINNVVRNNGEAILVLGTRRAESSIRARSMRKYSDRSYRERLSANAHLQNTLVYTPLEDWNNDDVWLFLMQYDNPWGHGNKELLAMYRGASQDGECPLVVDTSTPSCGKSRFGCWVCTLVEEDKSMAAMIQNDEEKDWMLPLVEFRNEIDFRARGPEGDRPLRDFRRMRGKVQMFKGRPVPGPYTQKTREAWLRRLLEIQTRMRRSAPKDVSRYELVGHDELEEIRRIWVSEKHEIEDTLPRIYEEATGEPYHGSRLDEDRPFNASEMAVLEETCKGDRLLYELARELIDIEHRFRARSRRQGITEELKKAVGRSFYESERDAIDYATQRDGQKERRREQISQVADAKATSDYIRQLELPVTEEPE